MFRLLINKELVAIGSHFGDMYVTCAAKCRECGRCSVSIVDERTGKPVYSRT